MATIKKRGKSYQLNWSQVGKQYRVSLGAVSKSQANAAKLHKEIELGEANGQAPHFDYFAAEYLKWYEGHYPASFERCRQIIVDRLSPHFGTYIISAINGRTVRDYEISRTTGDDKVKTGTYLKEFRTLKAILNKAVEWEYITSNPIGHVKPPKITDSKPPHFYTSEQLQDLYKSATGGHHKLAQSFRWEWQFMANTGLMLGEAMNIELNKALQGDRLQVISLEALEPSRVNGVRCRCLMALERP